MNKKRFLTRVVLIFLALSLATPGLAAQAETDRLPITTPEKFFGFTLGSDRKIARWDKIISYFRLLEKEGGGKLKVVDMGPATMGNPFLLVIVTSPENMARLEQLRQVNLRISDPRGLTAQEASKLVAEGRAVVCQSMSLHATEIGGTQMSPELAYDLFSRQDS